MSKRDDILSAAAKLFRENGARSTSTKSIALEAKTSEALIFKYFGTKEGLLEEIIKKGYKEATKIIVPNLMEKDALSYILKIVEISHILVVANPSFWKMQHKIMALNPISQKYHDNLMKPCFDRLKQAFSELKYENSELEAQLLLIYVEGMWRYFARSQDNLKHGEELIKLMKRKYDSN
ncbi:TetR/AcrR family transcriptional regulator [Flavobacterium macacae]|uniref:TetR/AcrR family transcriptional regulator n=1 Tax=Flavobacterium macacae TaxID=2488993 RepID=A0A3P3WA95_9FLAO|nr:TetR/AcrR family transcriptional regulator [Flavobacterium macacae]RRJ92075.1 TetR/AcrR family transcriptional regulator [Flavobacterium macacae]